VTIRNIVTLQLNVNFISLLNTFKWSFFFLLILFIKIDENKTDLRKKKIVAFLMFVLLQKKSEGIVIKIHNETVTKSGKVNNILIMSCSFDHGTFAFFLPLVSEDQKNTKCLYHICCINTLIWIIWRLDFIESKTPRVSSFFFLQVFVKKRNTPFVE